ncbi:hypothetical protein ILYODFUR_033351 [Ilyodon furcidens]|uniref:Uncharacterized protein n=1 Tax=Ilyodon furcidens TaxID=33524 RepID=A0ABV0SR88_9TELE
MDFHHRYVQMKLGRIMIFMIRSRGTDRNSHITGTSVHNQRYREASTPSGTPGTFMVSGLKTINHRCNSGQDTESKAPWRILQRFLKTTGWTGMDHATIR